MCGILAILQQHLLTGKELAILKDLIDRRGCDHKSPILEHGTTCETGLKLKASVLHIRGDRVEEQPVTDRGKNALLFNGHIYKYEDKLLNKQESDTRFLADKLMVCKSKDEIADTLASIDGPFALIYWHDELNTLFYGRDIFGRKSLCVLGDNQGCPYVISSVAMYSREEPHRPTWSEVDCKGFHCLEFELGGAFKQKTVYMWNLDSIYKPTIKCCEMEMVFNLEYKYLNHKPIATLNENIKNCNEYSNEDQRLSVSQFEKVLLEAVAKRTQLNKDTCLNCRLKISKQLCSHSRIAVAFSGGIDSTVIALALDKVIDKSETIDLITVAFKRDSPDRKSVGSALRELRYLSPHRNWRLVLCDIDRATLQEERNKTIRNLILPCKTVVDDSLGCACWFIGRGRGRALDSSNSSEEFNSILEKFLEYQEYDRKDTHQTLVSHDYTSPAAILFVGSSIDEQLGGYSSHRAAYMKGGQKSLNEEISFQMRRISRRNLGRDDRVYSDHCRDVKLPFLDDALVSYLNKLPVGLKMNLSESSETGPKKILRELARHWGLIESCRRVKRALQFGTRIANLEHPKEKGDETCARLL